MSLRGEFAVTLAEILAEAEGAAVDVIHRRAHQPDQPIRAVVAELPGEEFDESGRTTRARRRLTTAAVAQFRPDTDSRFVIAGEIWDVLGPPETDGLTISLELALRKTYGKGRR